MKILWFCIYRPMWREYDSSTTCVTMIGHDLHNLSHRLLHQQSNTKKYLLTLAFLKTESPWLAQLISDLSHRASNTLNWKPWLQKLLWRVSTKLDIHHVPWDESCCDLHFYAGVAYKNKPSSMLCAVCQSQLSLPQWEWCPTVGQNQGELYSGV